MIKRYNKFLLESASNSISLILEDYLYASGDFLSKLKKIAKSKDSSEIAEFIISAIEDEDYISIDKNYFDVTDKEDSVSFINPSRIPDSYDSDDEPGLPYRMKGRSEIKIGRIIKTILDALDDEEFKAKDIEKFVNAYKATKVNSDMTFSVLSGSDIEDGYNTKKYLDEEAGSLGGSCMNDEGKKILKLYIKNKSVGLLVYKDKKERILGRALLWKLDKSPCAAEYFMDRVYTNRDSDAIKFIDYAEENGYLYKKKMNSTNSDGVSFIYNGKDVYGEVIVNIDGDFEHYPFLDTMCFMDSKKTYLTNLSFENAYDLQDVSGGCSICSNCEGTVKIEKRTGRFYYRHVDNDTKLCYSCSLGHKTLAQHNISTKYN